MRIHLVVFALNRLSDFLVTVSGICSTHGLVPATDETQRQLQNRTIEFNESHVRKCWSQRNERIEHGSKTKGNAGIKCLVLYGRMHFHTIDHTAMYFIHLFTFFCLIIFIPFFGSFHSFFESLYDSYLRLENRASKNHRSWIAFRLHKDKRKPQLTYDK